NPLVHGTGFLPRHRQPPPCRRNVNHVPGLFCKRCYRFVPSPALSQRERESIGLRTGKGRNNSPGFSPVIESHESNVQLYRSCEEFLTDCGLKPAAKSCGWSLRSGPHPSPLPKGEGINLYHYLNFVRMEVP